MFRLAVPLAVLSVIYLIARLRTRRTGRKHTISWLPKGGADALAQLGIFVLADLCYETVRGIAESNQAVPFQNARSIVSTEKTLHLFVEQSIQSWAMGHRVLIDFANFMYVNSHFVITTSALVWLYLRHNDRFYFVRNMFVVAMGLALVGYLVLPTAPPRFFPELGFVDTLSYYVNVKHDSGLVTLFFNPYAAVPSMHVAFSLLVAVPALLIVRRKVFKALWALYPLVVTFVVIVTGNHWLMDALAGAAVAATAAIVSARVLARAWPAAWSWGPAGPRNRRSDAPRAHAADASRPEPPRLARRTGARRPPRSFARTWRERLVESRLTPNAISMTGFALNIPAAVLVTQRLFFLAGIAFIVGSRWTRSTAATRACRGRAPCSARSSTRRSTAIEEGVVLGRSPCVLRLARRPARRPRRSWSRCSAP